MKEEKDWNMKENETERRKKRRKEEGKKKGGRGRMKESKRERER